MEVEKLSSISSLMFFFLKSMGRENRISGRQSNITSSHISHHGTSLPRTPSWYPAPWNSCPDGLRSTLGPYKGPATPLAWAPLDPGVAEGQVFVGVGGPWPLWVRVSVGVHGAPSWGRMKPEVKRRGGRRGTGPALLRLWTWPWAFQVLYQARRLEHTLFRS